jgi:predicted transposase/invertase (TIGR01784 family)
MKTAEYILDTDDPIDIRIDGIFKAVFTKGTPESTGALSRLVSALIGRDITIDSILANEPAIGNTRDRQIRFDINCRAENGELFNVEMCLNPVAFEPVSLEFHAAKLYVGQDIKGSDKNYNDLKRAFQIAILAKEKFFPDEVFFHSFEYYDAVNKVSLNGRTRVITLELSKLDKVVEKPANEMSASERWAVFFGYLTDRSKRSKINEILKTEEGIAMAGQVLMKVSRDEEERARIMRDEKIELDYQSLMVYGKRQARAEGHAEGRKEERRHLLDMLNQGLSVEKIKQCLEAQSVNNGIAP